MFKLNQTVVYPSQGVGKIVEIKPRKMRITSEDGVTTEKDADYYTIYIASNDMTVLVPVESAKKFGIRQIVSKKDAEAALAMISEDADPVTSDWKQRYQNNLELLKKGTIFDIVKIVRSLYKRSRIKDLPTQERKFFESAQKLLQDEISAVLGKSEADVMSMISAQLNSMKGLPTADLDIPLDKDDDFPYDDDDEMEQLDSDDEDDDDDE